MIFADGSSEAIAWLVAAGGLITAIVAAYVTWSNNRNKIKTEAKAAKHSIRKDSLAEWQRIAETWKEQNERRDLVIDQLQEVSQSLAVENAENRTAVHFLYEHLKRVYNIALRLGATDLGEMPELPEMHETEKRSTFLLTQARQSIQLIKEADKTIPSHKSVNENPHN